MVRILWNQYLLLAEGVKHLIIVVPLLLRLVVLLMHRGDEEVMAQKGLELMIHYGLLLVESHSLVLVIVESMVYWWILR